MPRILTLSFHLLSLLVPVSLALKGSSNDDACTLYIAPSTVPNAGLGVFSAVPRQPGDSIEASADICIPFIDMYWHQPDYENPFHDYYWHGKAKGILTESKYGTMEAACFGLDCVVNCHIGLVNVFKSVPTYDQAGLHRAKHAGAGARSPYGVLPATVARAIPAGGELFQFHGDNWLTTTARTNISGNVLPTSQDYTDAQHLVEQLASLVYNQSLVPEDLLRIVTDIRNQQGTSSTLNAWPYSLKECFQAAEGDSASTLQSNHTRSLSWLKEHGRCVDHIVKGRSTLPDAGMGAFARHNIKQGQIITTSPLHHFTQIKYYTMDMYNITKHEKSKPPLNEDDEQKDDKGFHYQRHLDQIVNQQVAMNYCFGHAETTLLLCPYGPGVNFISHNQTLRNVKIRWAKGGFAGHDPQVVESSSLQELDELPPKLAFDYVALRDIAKGEELFLGYGDDYELAWTNHLVESEQKVKTKSDERYASGHRWNEHFADALIRTEDEQALDPYPDNIQVRCHHDVAAGSSATNYSWRADEYGFPCRIFDRFTEDGVTLYTVDVELWPEPGYHNKRPAVDQILKVLRTDIPRHALKFFDVPGTSDLHLSGTFRHWIGLPDNMLPMAWRNLLEDEDLGEVEEEG